MRDGKRQNRDDDMSGFCVKGLETAGNHLTFLTDTKRVDERKEGNVKMGSRGTVRCKTDIGKAHILIRLSYTQKEVVYRRYRQREMRCYLSVNR